MMRCWSVAGCVCAVARCADAPSRGHGTPLEKEKRTPSAVHHGAYDATLVRMTAKRQRASTNDHPSNIAVLFFKHHPAIMCKVSTEHLQNSSWKVKIYAPFPDHT